MTLAVAVPPAGTVERPAAGLTVMPAAGTEPPDGLVPAPAAAVQRTVRRCPVKFATSYEAWPDAPGARISPRGRPG